MKKKERKLKRGLSNIIKPTDKIRSETIGFARGILSKLENPNYKLPFLSLEHLNNELSELYDLIIEHTEDHDEDCCSLHINPGFHSCNCKLSKKD